jgi:hypothetical protein
MAYKATMWVCMACIIENVEIIAVL